MAFEACGISTIGLEKAHTDDNLRSVYYYCLLFIYYNNCYDGKTVPFHVSVFNNLETPNGD